MHAVDHPTDGIKVNPSQSAGQIISAISFVLHRPLFRCKSEQHNGWSAGSGWPRWAPIHGRAGLHTAPVSNLCRSPRIASVSSPWAACQHCVTSLSLFCDTICSPDHTKPWTLSFQGRIFRFLFDLFKDCEDQGEALEKLTKISRNRPTLFCVPRDSLRPIRLRDTRSQRGAKANLSYRQCRGVTQQLRHYFSHLSMSISRLGRAERRTSYALLLFSAMFSTSAVSFTRTENSAWLGKSP